MNLATPEEIREALGEERAIAVYRPNWDRVRENLLRMTFHVHYFRGTTRLEETDLGIEEGPEADFSKFMSNNVHLGTKRILPKSILTKLRNVEQRARLLFYRYTYDSDLGWLITVKGYIGFKKAVAPLEALFNEQKKLLYDNYDKIVEEMRDEYKILAAKAWRLKNPDATGLPPTAFINDYIEEVVKLIPSREAIQNEFYFGWTLAVIDLPVMTAEFARQEIDTLAARKAQIEAELARTRDDLSDLKARTDWRIEQARLQAELTAIEEERVARAEIRSRIEENAQSQITDTVQKVTEQFNQAVYDVATDVLISLRSPANQGQMRGKVVISLRNWIEQIQSLNFFDDDSTKEVDRLMEEVRRIVYTPSEERDKETLQDVLSEIRGVASANLIRLTKVAPRTMRELETPEAIEDSFRAARKPKLLEEARLAIPVERAGGRRGSKAA